MDTAQKLAVNIYGRSVGQPCSNRSRFGANGCIGHLVVRVGPHVDLDGKRSERAALICDRCGQAHGPAPVVCHHCRHGIFQEADGRWDTVYKMSADPYQCHRLDTETVVNDGHEPEIDQFVGPGQHV